MTKALVTGATGAVGHSIVEVLLREGAEVRALVRDVGKARAVLPAACELATGDVRDRGSIERALAGCDVLYHAAGLPEQWLRDPGVFDAVNAGGTRHAVEAALAAGVKRFVYTSTIDVFRAGPGEVYDESVLDPEPKHTVYERSKQEADRIVVAALDRGLDAVFLHPSAVYGPGPGGSNGINDLITRLARKQVPALLPGGFPVVFVRDVGEGHVRAAQRAKTGARYILSESYVRLTELAEMVAAKMNRRSVPPMMPLPVARAVAEAGELVAKLTKRPPLIARGQLTFLQWGARPSSRRAQEELGWRPTPIAEGLRETMGWLGLLAGE